ncbi:hypothetical protein FBU30_002378 [Linnemannia zychae]|nr:hypothetical protein FBU30_002378 [Linnemannia zychae]
MHLGHLRYFHNNSKAVLYDAKYNFLDSTFHRGTMLAVGDDMDMDKHLVTVEDLLVDFAANSGESATSKVITTRVTPSAPSHQQLKPIGRQMNTNVTITATPRLTDGVVISSAGIPQQLHQGYVENNINHIRNIPQSDLKRKKWRAPFANKDHIPPEVPDPSVDDLNDGDFENWDNEFISEDIDTPSPTSRVTGKSIASKKSTIIETAVTTSVPSFKPVPSGSGSSGSSFTRDVPKRRKVGLSRPAGSLETPPQASHISLNRPPSSQLEFPNAARCTNFTGKNSGQLLRRSMSLGSRFTTTNQYRDSMTFLIYEHLQIMVIEIAIIMWSIKVNDKLQESDSYDSLCRSRGVHIHSGSILRRRGDSYTGFPIYQGQSGASGAADMTSIIQPSSQQGAVLTLSNKEHHSRYSKDDLWVVSQSHRFDAASTFFARSTYYGPSGNDVEITCLSPSDSSKARDMFMRTNQVCAIRLFNAMSEFMMLDNLQNGLMKTPLLPTLLNYIPPEMVKASKTGVFKAPSRIPEKSGYIVLTVEDGIDVEIELQDIIRKYGLNHEQAIVLRTFAQTVIRAPGWGLPSSEQPPILLVHDIKELQAILNDDSLSFKERQYVKVALKRFQREENRGIVEKADVVGVTCVASMFEVMDEASFPIVILDESSQLLEPMSLIPICRAACQKVVMVGDPLQLSPPINTISDCNVKGLSRTLFDRTIEMGIKPIMLRTQYRCHERIAEISNSLFYSNVLRTGVSLEDRAPLIDGLPTLAFVENKGQEIQNQRSKSYTNPAEIKLIVTIILRLLNLNVPETSIGVISLYKSQADGIEAELSEQLKTSGQKGGVQISTVDAFQGSEKEIIIMSTVRTDAVGFIDNHQRVNASLYCRFLPTSLSEQDLELDIKGSL